MASRANSRPLESKAQAVVCSLQRRSCHTSFCRARNQRHVRYLAWVFRSNGWTRHLRSLYLQEHRISVHKFRISLLCILLHGVMQWTDIENLVSVVLLTIFRLLARFNDCVWGALLRLIHELRILLLSKAFAIVLTNNRLLPVITALAFLVRRSISWFFVRCFN